MKYQHRSFSVSLYAEPKSMAAVCATHGHMEPDQRGKCLRCGVRVTPIGYVSRVGEDAVEVTWPIEVTA